MPKAELLFIYGGGGGVWWGGGGGGGGLAPLQEARLASFN